MGPGDRRPHRAMAARPRRLSPAEPNLKLSWRYTPDLASLTAEPNSLRTRRCPIRRHMSGTRGRTRQQLRHPRLSANPSVGLGPRTTRASPHRNRCVTDDHSFAEGDSWLAGSARLPIGPKARVESQRAVPQFRPRPAQSRWSSAVRRAGERHRQASLYRCQPCVLTSTRTRGSRAE